MPLRNAYFHRPCASASEKYVRRSISSLNLAKSTVLNSPTLKHRLVPRHGRTSQGHLEYSRFSNETIPIMFLRQRINQSSFGQHASFAQRVEKLLTQLKTGCFLVYMDGIETMRHFRGRFARIIKSVIA